MQTNYKYQLHFNLIYALLPVKRVVRQNWTLTILFADWGDFFRRITNHEDPQKLARMLEKSCPKVVDLMNTASGYALISIGYALISIDDKNLGISRHVPLPLTDDRHIPCLAGDSTMVKEAEGLLDYCLDLYEEIYNKCPFPGWKKGLEELW